MNFDDDFNVAPEALAEAESMAGFNLRVPPSVENTRKGGVARWLQFFTIEGASRKAEEGPKGQKRTAITLKAKVMPGVNPENIGRFKTEFLRMNFGMLSSNPVKRSEALAEGDAAKEQFMNGLSIKKLRAFAKVAGLDLAAGLSNQLIDAMFPLETEDGTPTKSSVLNGIKFAAQVSDNESKKSPAGENNQNLDNIVPAPSGF